MVRRSAPHVFEGMSVSDLELAVPLDPADVGAGELTLFARLVEAEECAGEERPHLVFLQGGPGFSSPRPETRTGWLKRALEEFHVVLLDQRGTGRSSPVTSQSLDDLCAAEQAAHLAHFRADAIVRDAECLRAALGLERWTVLGQSYGGFCAVHYLSSAPNSLDAALIAGGLPPLEAHPDDIYRRTYVKVRERGEAYYTRYPEDRERVGAITGRLAAEEVLLPCGDRLTARRFLSLGLQLGMSDGFEKLHYLVEQAYEPTRGRFAHAFLRGFESAQSYDTNPIFSVLHEACYTQGFASRWSAERVLAEYPEFATRAEGTSSGPLFTGEMIYPWMFDEIGALGGLRDAAHLLAEKEDWPALYDLEVLASNRVPAAAAIYVEDMYVERGYSEETAARIQGLVPWVTSDYLHNGLRADGGTILDELLLRART